VSWSDDRFKSTFHRVKAPCEQGDYYGERYGTAFFNQPCRDCEIQGLLKKYPIVTGEEFTRDAMTRNFRTLEARTREQKHMQYYTFLFNNIEDVSSLTTNLPSLPSFFPRPQSTNQVH
jgi:hypothetical protein